ncbi:hypothetical protein H6P81_020137 [Aristolochia fimbriata]|uniref:Defensin-like protein n=1 Tax=Aristolochia fimbriata TaxID=158543 RepID=A0AAV7DTN4_ARIFI|nr:hypothetical protein H6P81_020137 [Aristolochia fimbriata]
MIASSSLLLLLLALLLLSLAQLSRGECQVYAPELQSCSSNCAAFCRGSYHENLIQSVCVGHLSLCTCVLHCSAPPSAVNGIVSSGNSRGIGLELENPTPALIVFFNDDGFFSVKIHHCLNNLLKIYPRMG